MTLLVNITIISDARNFWQNVGGWSSLSNIAMVCVIFTWSNIIYNIIHFHALIINLVIWLCGWGFSADTFRVFLLNEVSLLWNSKVPNYDTQPIVFSSLFYAAEVEPFKLLMKASELSQKRKRKEKKKCINNINVVRDRWPISSYFYFFFLLQLFSPAHLSLLLPIISFLSLSVSYLYQQYSWTVD